MYRTLHRVSVLKRILDDSAFITPNLVNGLETIRSYAGRKEKAKQSLEREKIVPFCEVLSEGLEEAGRSVLVQVQSEQSCGDLLEYCSGLGGVRTMQHYKTPKNSHFVLVEMENQQSLKSVLGNASHPGNTEIVPVHSHLLWFKIPSTKKKKTVERHEEKIKYSVPLSAEIKFGEGGLSRQMRDLHESTRINDLGNRLRFLSARQIESGLSGLFPNVRVCPFGSSANGFGRNGCDLDLVVLFSSLKKTDSRLVYHAKTSSSDERLQVQNHIEILADLMQLFMPGCVNIKKILHARVPIIKYKQELTNLECDVSLYNQTCMPMTELLYVFGSVDERVRPLVFTIRCWAKATGLTNPAPGRWITNFSLSLLALFFLQQPSGSQPSVLPSAAKMFRYKDEIMTSNQFLSCLLDLRTHLHKNTLPLDELLLSFFQFYGSFDFGVFGLNLLTGKFIGKPDYSAMYIVNPIEPDLNVSKNVSPEEVVRLQSEMRNAAWIIETCMEDKRKDVLTRLLTSSTPASVPKNSRARLVDVKTLFDS